jgi:hypothetical protein
VAKFPDAYAAEWTSVVVSEAGNLEKAACAYQVKLVLAGYESGDIGGQAFSANWA